jgi:hypothetical protein
VCRHVPVYSVNDDAFGNMAHGEDSFRAARLGGGTFDELPGADELDRSDALSVIIGKCLRTNPPQLQTRQVIGPSSMGGCE